MAETNTKKEFLNVYNFVSLPRKRAEKYNCQDEHTGVITYSITTKTPLFIPNTSSDQAFRMEKNVPIEHKSYDFYSYREMELHKEYDELPEKPVLPGSELRGMIRGIYETLTDSCMGVLNEEELPSLRTNTIFQAGLLHRCGKNKEKNEWELVKAEQYRYRMNNDKTGRTYEATKYQEGQKLYYQNSGKRIKAVYKTKPEKGVQCEGYLLKGMGDRSLGKKHSAGIFQAKKVNGQYQIERTLTDRDIERLQAVLKSYREQPEAEENCYQEYQDKLKEFLAGKGEAFFPVYYSIAAEGNKKKNLLYLAPACITREVSHHTIGELAGNFAPCKSAETMCPACDLFGRIGKSNEEAHVSKLRFADAYPEQDMEPEAYYKRLQPITLESLAGPKIGNVEFYLKRPNINSSFWTYDYHVRNGEMHIEPGVLRGRKYYWHQPGVTLPGNIEKTKLNKTVRPVKEEVTFTGKVYFDKISQTQLNQMIWILNCGADNSDLAYKLGAGKPLGLGSVKCKVMEVTERTVGIADGKLSYLENCWKPDIPTYEELHFSKSCKDEFFCINSFHAAEKVPQISYPVTEDQFGKPVQEGFKWFVQNHSANKNDQKKKSSNKKIGGREKMIIHKNLPDASKVQCLPCEIRGEKTNSGKN